MATSDPDSSLADWAEFYSHNQGVVGPAMTLRQPSSLQEFSTAANTATCLAGMADPANSPPSHANLDAGRVGKSPRRRSRASRRTPVTLLNTDTNNFRAMVQQFTGIPSGPYSSGGLPDSSGGTGPTISFGLDFNAPSRPNGALMSLGQQLQPQQYQRPPPFQEQVFLSQQQQQQYQYNPNMFTPDEFNVHNHNSSTDNNNMFIHGFTPDDGILMDSTSGPMMSKVTKAGTNIRDGGYFG